MQPFGVFLSLWNIFQHHATVHLNFPCETKMIELPYIRLYSFIHHKFFNVVGFVFLLKPFFVRVCSEESWGWPHAKCLSPSKEWMFWMCCRIRSSRSSLHSAAQYQTWFTILLTQGINSSFSFFFATSTDFLRFIFAKCQTSKWHSSFMYFLICTCQSLQKGKGCKREFKSF